MREQQAQLEKKIYFWHNPRTNHILQGAGPRWDHLKLPGYDTIECKSAHEAELWSERLRLQDKQLEESNAYERELIESGMRADLRRELQFRLIHASNRLNAAMLEAALKQLDEQEAKGKVVRESWLHSEGYEEGHGQ